MVGLQAAALQANRDARVQSVASNLARELAEMMRGNKDISVLTGSSNPYLGDFDNTSGAAPLAPTTTSYCLNVGAATCAAPPAPDIANAQMTDWLSRVDSELPGARVVVCSDSAPFDASGLPQWACGTGAGATLVIKIGWTRGSTNRSKTNAQLLERATVPSLVLPITPGNAA